MSSPDDNGITGGALCDVTESWLVLWLSAWCYSGCDHHYNLYTKYVGRINNVVEVPPPLAPANLPEFLWPPPALADVELVPELEQLPEYIPLPEIDPMPLYLPYLEPIVPEVPALVIEISSSNSSVLAVEPRQASTLSKSNPSEVMSTTASRVYQHNPKRAHSSGPRWIHTSIIPWGRGWRGGGHWVSCHGVLLGGFVPLDVSSCSDCVGMPMTLK